MNRVAAERKLLNITQVQLADRLDVSESTIVRWENGGNIPQEKLVEMRLIFKCNLEWLLGLSDDRLCIREPSTDDERTSTRV